MVCIMSTVVDDKNAEAEDKKAGKGGPVIPPEFELNQTCYVPLDFVLQ